MAFSGSSLGNLPAFSFTVPATEIAYQPTTTAAWYANEDVHIPTVPEHRAIYLHGLNAVLEGLCGDTNEPPSKRDAASGLARWTRVSAKLQAHWFEHRKNMSLEHRRIVWLVFARVQFIIGRNTPDHREIHACAFARDRSLQMSVTRIPQKSVKDLWMTVYALMLAWSTLNLTNDVQHYVSALCVQIGRFCWLAQADARVFDHPSFVITVGEFGNAGVVDENKKFACDGELVNGLLCINASFLQETERVFYIMMKDIDEWKRLRSRLTVHSAPRAVRHVETLKWLGACISVEARREGVQELFEKRVYERRAHPGEVELLMERDAHQLHNAYNAIARFRPNVIDETAELINADRTIEDLLDVAETWRPDGVAALSPTDAAAAAADAVSSRTETASQCRRRIAAEANRRSDADDTVMCALAMSLDGVMASDSITFLDYFSSTTFPIPRSKHPVPILMFTGNRWHVVHGDDFFECETVIDALECWIVRVCRDNAILTSIAHIAPNVSILFGAYREIVGRVAPADVARTSAAFATLTTTAVALPSCYG